MSVSSRYLRLIVRLAVGFAVGFLLRQFAGPSYSLLAAVIADIPPFSPLEKLRLMYIIPAVLLCYLYFSQAIPVSAAPSRSHHRMTVIRLSLGGGIAASAIAGILNSLFHIV